MRYLFGLLCICAVGAMPLIGCDDAEGDGGSGGSAGSGGNGGSAGDGGTVGSACDRELCDGVDCDDADPCTEDRCSGADGTCSYLARCDDFNECTTETCDPGNESCSTPTPVANGTSCAGGTCQSGVCVLSGTVLPCTEQGIRNAIAAGDGTYTFDCDGTAPVMTQAEIEIDNNVILDGEGKLTVDGNCEHRVFLVNEGVTAGLHGLTVTRGGWVEPHWLEESGGGIDNGGTLTMTNCNVTHCSIPVSGNPMGVGSGGGIANHATLTITNSTVSGNDSAEWGGGISNGGTLTLTNSTVSGNSPDGLRTVHEGTVAITNSTLSDNRDAAITKVGGPGTLTVANSLVVGDCPTTDPDFSVISDGYNIESPGDTCGFDQTTDQINISADDLKLGELADNGGPTMTHALGDGSVAIDHIPAVDCGVTIDQRGEPRPVGDGCDVGSFERQPEDP